MTNRKEYFEQLKKTINGDVCNLVENVFRIRDAYGKLIDYKLVPSHRQLLQTGILGDRSAMGRIILKGRQAGFSIFQCVESCTIATMYPSTYQYYIASKEKQAKSWLSKVEKIALDSRLMIDGNRIIDIDERHSSQLEKTFRSFSKEDRKRVEESYICGLASSHGGVRGETAVNVILDEFAFWVKYKNQQRDTYEAVKKFVSQGGQMTIQSTPYVKSDLFWELYTNAEANMMTGFNFPVIENWEHIDLTMPLYIEEGMERPEMWQYYLNSNKYEYSTIIAPTGKVVKIGKLKGLDIPYFWTDLRMLERDRREDLTYFMQENLCVPADTTARFITPDLVNPCVDSVPKSYNDNHGFYLIAVDVAKDRDMTVATVGEIVNGELYEREIVESQESYNKQFTMLENLAKQFKPAEIRIDTTGSSGEALADFCEVSPYINRVKKIDYRTKVNKYGRDIKIKEYMSESFKTMLTNGTYHLIENRKAISHILRVTRSESGNGNIVYSGKANGRDDHYWSKVMLALDFNDICQREAFSVYNGGGETNDVQNPSFFRYPHLAKNSKENNFVHF